MVTINSDMIPKHFDADICIMTRFSNLISGKWKPIILYLIQKGHNRFSQLQVKMPRISKKILAEQLKDLEADRLITREEIKSKEPKIVIYSLTSKGESLRKLIDTIIQWSLEFEKDFKDEALAN